PPPPPPPASPERSDPVLIFDAHLDLGMNALMWNRDLTRTIDEIRRQEAEMEGKGRACNTVSLPELRRGRVAVTVGTVLARTGSSPAPNLPTYRSAEIAYGMAQGQLAHYRILERQGRLALIRDRERLDRHWSRWVAWERDAGASTVDATEASDDVPPPGLILSMEGADSIPSPDEVPLWWENGLRAIGITHYQDNVYAHGTGTEGGLKPPAKPLLEAIRSCGMLLDLTHLADQAFWEALDLWDGPVLASHNNCRTLVPGQRQFSDEQLRAIIERGGVIGCALDAWMLYPGWIKRVTTPEVVGLEAVADHVAHVCELAGNAEHVAIGSDLDGGFGTEQTPRDLNTIADLQKIAGLLRERGFAESDVERVMHRNWLEHFRKHLPAG
ncbi:MAG: membrane dipeptidase, partial [Trueperaceae bacterium]